MPLLSLAALAIAAAPPDASIGAPVEAPALTVTTTRLTDAQIAVGARGYLRAVLPTPAYGQYARWADPICVKISGITDIAAARVAARITATADGAGIKRGKPGCRTNLSVVFSEDAAATVDRIVRKKPKQIYQLNGTERRTLLTDPLPVRWWHGLELRDADGQPAMPGGSSALMSAQSDAGVPLFNMLPANAPQTDSWSSSLIDSHIAVWATSAVVVVDVTLASGKSLDAVADYVALVSLATMKLPPPAPGVPSILALFTQDGREPGLSNWDKAFLSSLYRMPMNRSGDRQRSQLINGISADLRR